MKIINREDFLKMPKGTLFRVLESGHGDLGELAIKLDTNDNNDFFVQYLDGFISSDDMHRGRQDSTFDIKLNFEISQRDGCFDDSQKFAIYDPLEVLQLILRIVKLCDPFTAHMEKGKELLNNLKTMNEKIEDLSIEDLSIEDLSIDEIMDRAIERFPIRIPFPNENDKKQ